MKEQTNIGCAHIRLLIFLFIGISFALLNDGCSPYRHLDSFTGKVVDTDTKEPIAGAVVLAVYYDSSVSVAGSSSYAVDAQETLTDEKGEFKIPAARKWFRFTWLGHTRGSLTIFKPGYGVFPRHKRSQAVGENKTWPPPEKYIVYEIPKLKTREERAHNVFDVNIEYKLEFSKQKLAIRQVNTEFENLGMLDRYIEKNGKPALALVR